MMATRSAPLLLPLLAMDPPSAPGDICRALNGDSVHGARYDP